MTAATLTRRLDRVGAVLAARPAPTQSGLSVADMRRIPPDDRAFLAAIAERCPVGANGKPDLSQLGDGELDRLAGIAELFLPIVAGGQATGAGGASVSVPERTK